MRVIAGQVKGHRLRAPRGVETRPTSDKVRGAIFDVLGAASADDSVLDLFAGSGALGIEALSRGARQATFVERRPAACQTIRENLRHTRFEGAARVLCMPVERVLSVLDEPFGLILADPPYAYPGLHGIMTLIAEARVIGDATTVVFEHSPRFAVEARYARLALWRQKVYGDTAVSIFVVPEEMNE
ncbi:MAG TPA: 16S rRNA (guanine(966)-N(2))-methyltransferase RsmD [Chloroflexota bacterium]|nr:16S rRNA (guanine(966)-N(2))-methyltransferase RsmD [Chloroflexota bacterium]